MREQSIAIARIRNEIEPILVQIGDQLHATRVDADCNELSVHFFSTPEDERPGLMLRVVVSDEQKVVAIPNIFKPQIITQRGVGRSLIAATRAATVYLGYRLFIVDLVRGFHRKLISWGGTYVDEETVEITDTTRLTDVTPGRSTFNDHDATYLSEAEREAGYERFIGEHPEVISDIEAMNPQLAEILGIDPREHRRTVIAEALERNARARGIDSFEYLLSYAIESADKRQRILQTRRDVINKALGL